MTFQDVKTKLTQSELFDTVLFAMGRAADTRAMGLEHAGVTIDPSDGKIRGFLNEQTNVPHIFAVGDCFDPEATLKLHDSSASGGALELTPVAIQAGILWAKRMYGGSHVFMDYHKVPTTVFTPMEYGSCGMTEEDAIAKFGADNIEIYISEYSSLELAYVVTFLPPPLH